MPSANDTSLPLRGGGRLGPLLAGLGGGVGALVGYGGSVPVGGAVLAGVGAGLGAVVGMYAEHRLSA